MDNEDVVYIYTMEYYLAIKENELLTLATIWMDLEIVILSEASQTEKDKYRMLSLIGRILKMIQTNLFTQQKQTQRRRKQTYGHRRGKGGEGIN